MNTAPARGSAVGPPFRPRGLSTRKLRFEFFTPRRAVQWLAPGQLARTAIKVAVAEGVGAYLDKREQQAMFADTAFDEAGDRDELWLDYVADSGDGFNATYAVAYSLGRDHLPVKGVAGQLPRGQVLVLGGDQVYPTPSASNYDDRFRGPFQAALPDVPPGHPRPTLYALPGNHDWYDGLTAFLRVFGVNSSIGGWTTRQRRSYYALRLPHGWWLFALDAQKGAYIDDPQLEYFHRVINESVADGDRIILCTPEPSWVQANDEPEAFRATDFFLRRVIEPTGQQRWLQEAYGSRRAPAPKQVTVPLMLSGDWHHYSRYERTDDGLDRRQLVTAGGGGAFLFGTQHLPRKITTPPPDLRPPRITSVADHRRRARYPSAARSFWLGLGAPVRLPWRNPTFVVLLGLMQGLLWYAWERAGGQPTFGVIALVVLVLGGTMFLAAGLAAPGRNKFGIVVFGFLHALGQLVGVRAVMVPLVDMAWAPTLTKPTAALAWNWDLLAEYGRYYAEWVGWYVVYGLAAGVVSAAVVGLYFMVASVFRLNLNELFSSQRIEGYKSFVRLHITPTGDLTAYVVGLARVRRLLPGFRWLHWKANARGEPWEPWFTPRKRLRYRLVDTFTIPR